MTALAMLELLHQPLAQLDVLLAPVWSATLAKLASTSLSDNALPIAFLLVPELPDAYLDSA
jgi:hypothetical protein